MGNYLICNNCKTENPLYAANCKLCNSFLRSKISNIDLWDSVWGMLTEPIKTSIKLIQSERKNFLISLLLLWIIKSSINNFILKNYYYANRTYPVSITDSILDGGVIAAAVLIFFSFLITKLFSLLKIETRFKDNITIYTFSLIPILLFFVFITPFHFALYGFYWYTFNPSPLIIKPLETYILYGIEFLFMIWSLILFILVSYTQTRKKIISIIIGLTLFISTMFFHLLQM